VTAWSRAAESPWRIALERLFKKIDGAEFHCFDGQGDVTMSGNDHDREPACQRLHALE